ncbi:MAG: thiamine pyrophosphate-dependent enzyme [Geminicoccaceae bacterium]
MNDLFAREEAAADRLGRRRSSFTAMEIARPFLTAPGYYAGMGYGVPAGIGCQLATGRRTLILVGDGAFQMTGWELGTARGSASTRSCWSSTIGSWRVARLPAESSFNDPDDRGACRDGRGHGADGPACDDAGPPAQASPRPRRRAAGSSSSR